MFKKVKYLTIMIISMWFRNKNGKMVEIKRLDYFTDTQYYNAIMKIKIGSVIQHKNNSHEKIKNLIGYKNS